MIQRITVFLFCISVGISQSRVHVNSLVFSSEKWLDGKDNKPFTGIAYNESTNTGNKLQESKYLKGLLHGTHIEWWETGNKKVYGRYRSGKKNGRWVHYFENGQIKSEGNYKNGERDGLETRWHKNGIKRSKGMYNNGQKTGEWVYWDEQGDLVHYVCIQTNFGTIVIDLYFDVAPMHAESFKMHANTGYYNGTIFHRVIPGFVIQGGDPNSKTTNRATHGMGGSAASFYGIGNKQDPSSWKLPAEFNTLQHKRGTLSMARGFDQNSAGSQFFICVDDAPNLDNNYTVFGEVIDGLGIIDRIINVSVDGRNNPMERIEMEISVCN